MREGAEVWSTKIPYEWNKTKGPVRGNQRSHSFARPPVFATPSLPSPRLHPCDQLFSNCLTPLTAGTPRIRVKEAKKDSSRIVKEEAFFMFPLTQEEETPPPRIAPRTGAALLLITAFIIVITLSPDFSSLDS